MSDFKPGDSNMKTRVLKGIYALSLLARFRRFRIYPDRLKVNPVFKCEDNETPGAVGTSKASPANYIKEATEYGSQRKN